VIASAQLVEIVQRAAMNSGFDRAGIAPVREEDYPEIESFAEWIGAGYAGDMKYMEQRNERGELRRARVRNSAPWARSVVVCALNYSAGLPYSTEVSDPGRGWISRYAWGSKDYHDVLLPRLRQVESELKDFAAQYALAIETRAYVDTGPILERVYAKYAGIGWIGKNTCVINQQFGSWLFLGALLTSLEVEPARPADDRCGSCTRCIDACPTQAILAPGKLDARRCIAYLTIEKRGAIPEELRGLMGQHVFGCDICQDICPWNNKPGNAPPAQAPEFQPREHLFHPDLRWLAQMDVETYRRTFRGSPVKRARYSGLRRNIAVAMGNSGNKEFLPELKKMAKDADPIVAEHAQWALNRLGG